MLKLWSKVSCLYQILSKFFDDFDLKVNDNVPLILITIYY